MSRCTMFGLYKTKICLFLIELRKRPKIKKPRKRKRKRNTIF